MNKKDKFFQEFYEKIRNDISFITIKKGASITFKNNIYSPDKELPVPVRVQNLLADIKKQDEVDGITLSNIIDGIIYIAGSDINFELMDEYIKMLEKFNFDLKPYIIYCINKFDEEESERGVVYGKALVNLEENEKSCFVYASALEKMGLKYNEENKAKKGQIFLEEANKYFEKCLDYDEKFTLSLYKLGFYYKRSQQYVKAELIWNKHQETEDDPLRIDEIRNELIQLKPYVDYEKGYNLVLKEKPEEGLELLLPLVKQLGTWWNLLFFIGLAYRALGQYDIAETYFENVLKLEHEQKDALNELGLCKLCRKKYVEAAEIFTDLLNIDPGNCEVFCNRAVALMYNNQLDRAKEDIQTALKINPYDSVALSIKEELYRK
ncbi:MULTISPECIES: tetratricopeptide repeat protein [unclassified Sedimentibacter]|uniref:tetratricopeptide repeat protein n=1 Tax=unclassified Sedimentibacter TaxID=2649220 RepID=UPI0027DEEA3C|nr:tetratricopeptide repeat protein [Sedimentibacter sp. MB35-C1]WMJ76538.1 tetratricopeptide repeat protein [Sedimentibacter sp. MB35-C1]